MKTHLSTGDVYWIYQQLVKTPEGVSLIHLELPSNHYQLVGYDRGDRAPVNQIIYCLFLPFELNLNFFRNNLLTFKIHF